MAKNFPNKKFDFNVNKNSSTARKLRAYIQRDQEYTKSRILNDITTRIALWFKYCRYDYFDEDIMSYDKIVSIFLKDYNISINSKEELLIDIEILLKKRYAIDILNKNPLVLSFNGTFKDIEI